MARIVGHVVRIQPPMEIFGIELLYIAIIIALCAIILWKTKESYELTKHKGIKYFRMTFLFLLFGYILRFILLVMFIYRDHYGHQFLTQMKATPFFLMGYFTVMSLFALIYATLHKKIKWSFETLGVIAVIFSSLVVFGSFDIFLVLIALGLLVYFVVKIFMRGLSKMNVLYFSLFVLWMLHLFTLEKGISVGQKFMLYLGSVAILAFLTYKVFRRFSNAKRQVSRHT